MIILGIETSCDETAASVVKDGQIILSNIIATSSQMHVKTGGIIPENAARQQIKSIIPVIEQSLVEAFTKNHSPVTNHLSVQANQSLITHIDAFAVTVGPGLIGSLLVGVETAKTLSYIYKKPIIPVNHLVGHIYANWLENNSKSKINNYQPPKFPVLALVVSGGHTDLVLVKDHGNITWVGGTLDDAAGEAFDKCARLLGLPYPGGPAISNEAEKFFYNSSIINHQSLKLFPRPLMNERNFNWSFSGLKTAVLREVKDKSLKGDEMQKLAAEIQEAIVDSLVEKTIRALKFYRPASFVLAGGVAANKRLREKFSLRIKSEKLQVYFHVPLAILCTDNAACVTSYAFFNYKPLTWKNLSVNPQLTITKEL